MFADLAQIRALVESSGVGGSICPSCEMPFDKGKKRRLIDDCGHERCYSCTFRSDACPICTAQDYEAPDSLRSQTVFGRGSTSQLYTKPSNRRPQNSSGARARTREDVEDWVDDTTAVNALCGSPRPRVKTNGHFTPFMQVSTYNCKIE